MSHMLDPGPRDGRPSRKVLLIEAAPHCYETGARGGALPCAGQAIDPGNADDACVQPWRGLRRLVSILETNLNFFLRKRSPSRSWRGPRRASGELE